MRRSPAPFSSNPPSIRTIIFYFWISYQFRSFYFKTKLVESSILLFLHVYGVGVNQNDFQFMFHWLLFNLILKPLLLKIVIFSDIFVLLIFRHSSNNNKDNNNSRLHLSALLSMTTNTMPVSSWIGSGTQRPWWMTVTCRAAQRMWRWDHAVISGY